MNRYSPYDCDALCALDGAYVKILLAIGPNLKDGRCTVSLKTIARKVGYHFTHVSRVLREMAHKGIVEIEARYNTIMDRTTGRALLRGDGAPTRRRTSNGVKVDPRYLVDRQPELPLEEAKPPKHPAQSPLSVQRKANEQDSLGTGLDSTAASAREPVSSKPDLEEKPAPAAPSLPAAMDAPAPGRATALPADFIVPPEWINAATEKRLWARLPAADLHAEAIRFVCWAVGNAVTSLNWEYCWYKFALNQKAQTATATKEIDHGKPGTRPPGKRNWWHTQAAAGARILDRLGAAHSPLGGRDSDFSRLVAAYRNP